MRYVLGPSFTAVSTAPVPAPAPVVGPDGKPLPVLADIEIALKAVDQVAWHATVTIPPYDLATHNKLAEIRVYLAAEGSTVPTDGDGWVASPHAFETAEVGQVQTGVEASIPLPVVPPAKYLGQTVLGFDR